MAVTYTLHAGDLIQLQIVGKLHGQRIRTVLHYAFAGDDHLDGEAALESLDAVFEDFVLTTFLAFQSVEYRCDYIFAQVIKPVRYRPVVLTVEANGTVEGSSCPSGVAAVVSRYGTPAGPQYQGRTYVAGVPVSSETDSKLIPAAVDLLDAIGAATAEPLLVGLGGNSAVPLTSGNVTTPVSITYQVQQYLPREELHYQRRRAVGRGE